MEKQDNPPPPAYNASANPQSMPPQGGPSGYPPQGQPPQGYPPQGQPAQGYPPQGVPSQGYPPQAIPPPGHPAYGDPPQSYPVTVAPVGVVVRPAVQMYGESPLTMTCPHCQAQMVTKIDYKVGLLTWMIVGILCVFFLWPCFLCLIPFCVKDCKDVVHTCSNCNVEVGRKNRLS